MIKRIISLLMVAVLAFALVACGNSDVPEGTDNTHQQGTQSGIVDNSNENDKTDHNTKVDLSQTLTFMGYSISYPGDAGKNASDYGNIVGDSNYCLVVEAPSIAGKMIDVKDINDAPSLCEEYVMHTLEHKIRSLFDYDSTTQEIIKATEVTYNDVEMLLVEGTFTNDRNNSSTKFSAIYLLAGDNGNLPVYIVGISMEENYDVSGIVEAVAQNIKK